MEDSVASMFEPAALGFAGASRVAVGQRISESGRVLN
jgi:hypothetical protein